MPIHATPIRLLTALAIAAAAPALLHPAPAAAATSTDSKMFTLDSVTFDGNARVPTDTLNSVVGLTVGDKVNRDSIVQAFQNVQDEYMKENVGGTIQPVMTTKGNHMSVVFKIAEAAAVAPVTKQPVLDHETFTGNAKVSSAKLQTALTIKPGTDVTRELIIADMQALSKVYKDAQVNVMITPKGTSLPQGHMDLNFEIVENPPPAAKK